MRFVHIGILILLPCMFLGCTTLAVPSQELAEKESAVDKSIGVLQEHQADSLQAVQEAARASSDVVQSAERLKDPVLQEQSMRLAKAVEAAGNSQIQTVKDAAQIQKDYADLKVTAAKSLSVINTLQLKLKAANKKVVILAVIIAVLGILMIGAVAWKIYFRK